MKSNIWVPEIENVSTRDQSVMSYSGVDLSLVKLELNLVTIHASPNRAKKQLKLKLVSLRATRELFTSSTQIGLTSLSLASYSRAQLE